MYGTSFQLMTILIVSVTLSIPLLVASQQINDEQRVPSGPLRESSSGPQKRASFMPSRGKKENLNWNEMDSKRASAFLPMRGRKDYYSQGWILPAYDSVDSNKRAGFMPMRGKKEDDADRIPFDFYQSQLDEIKRASFMPMRGRKNNDMNDDDAIPLRYQNGITSNWMEGGPGEIIDKRAKAFFGARGKRSSGGSSDGSSDGHNTHHDKHIESFFATRG